MLDGVCDGAPRDIGADTAARSGRLRRLGYEFAKFAMVGITGVVVTNAIYDLLYLHVGIGPVTSTTIATVAAAVVTFLGNRYWSFRTRQRTGAMREVIVFAVLNGIRVTRKVVFAGRVYLAGDRLSGGLSCPGWVRKLGSRDFRRCE